jgi:hypothetical protein
VFAVVLLAGRATAEPPIAPGPSDTVLDATTDAEAPAPIERITTIGASATAGFGVNFWRFEGEK